MIRSKAQTKEWDVNYDNIDWGSEPSDKQSDIRVSRDGDDPPYIAVDVISGKTARAAEPWEAYVKLERLLDE